jgi:hypothetical protein
LGFKLRILSEDGKCGAENAILFTDDSGIHHHAVEVGVDSNTISCKVDLNFNRSDWCRTDAVPSPENTHDPFGSYVADEKPDIYG